VNLLKNIEFRRVMNGVAAGTTDQTSTVIDTQGFDGVLLIGAWGTITGSAVTSMRAQLSSDDSSYSDMASSDQTVADTDDNKVTLLDVYRPTKRYIKVVMKRATQNAVIDGVFAVLYKGARRCRSPRARPSS
jgi:hypothetical protein